MLKRKVRDFLVGPVTAIVVTLAVFAFVGGLLVVLEPSSTTAAAPATGGTGISSSLDYAPPGQYGSGTLGPWQKLLRRISPEDDIRDALTFNGIFMFGDSIAVQDESGLERLLAARTGDTIAVHNWSGQPTSAAVDALEGWSRDYGLPGRILMAVGTNDIFNPPAFGAQVERAMQIAGPNRTVYWVNVEVSRFRQDADAQASDRANSAWINQQLEEAAMRHPNLRIIHWAEYLAAQPDGLAKYLRDGVHTTEPIGADARNELIAQAIEDADGDQSSR
ncbi:GDSL-type esterase/lipase family protein [Kribbella sp. NPDC051952]|uniref:GDSL-type esterase/lipase family protein n=1 Tax=Kribbella sp. NPDC051952 TaxID=3154851 RepID=UPI003434BBB3